VTAKLVPLMAVIYLTAAFVIILMNITDLPGALGKIVTGAFAPEAVGGGIIGVLIQGLKRATFSNEAGIGSAPIAHSAVRTKEPVTEGIVALLEPFIDTVVICTMTALVIVVTGTYQTKGLGGIDITAAAFESAFSWFPYVLTLAVLLFAFSTMIAWSYYGLKAWTYLFGESRRAEVTYKVIFCVFVIIGASIQLGPVIDFSDAMFFAMSIANIIGLYILMPVVKKELTEYFEKLRTGVIVKYA
jgi:alanine or glycine:cation symporter, AGCS family